MCWPQSSCSVIWSGAKPTATISMAKQVTSFVGYLSKQKSNHLLHWGVRQEHSSLGCPPTPRKEEPPATIQTGPSVWIGPGVLVDSKLVMGQQGALAAKADCSIPSSVECSVVIRSKKVIDIFPFFCACETPYSFPSSLVQERCWSTAARSVESNQGGQWLEHLYCEEK